MKDYMTQPQKPYTPDQIKDLKSKIIRIRENLKLQGKFPDNFLILKELKKFKYFLKMEELREYMKEFSKDSNFVLELAKWGYNGLVEDVIDRLNMIDRGCDEIIEKKWTKSKVIITEEINNGRRLKKKKVITNEVAGPKTGALKIQKMTTKVRTDILKGGIIDASVAIFARDAKNTAEKYRKTMEELDKLEQKIKNNDTIIAKLKEQEKTDKNTSANN